MPISPTLITHAEIVLAGQVAAGGSNSRTWATVWNYRRTSTVSALSKTALATAFVGTLKAPLLAALNVRLTLANLSIRWIDDALDAPFYVTETGSGAVTGDSMPTDNAVYLMFGTGLRGRSYRGSKHLFPVSESATTSGTDDILNSGAITLFGAVAAAALLAITDSSGNVWNPCVYSRTLSQPRVNPTSIVTNDVVSVSLNKRVGSMRHRKVKSVY